MGKEDTVLKIALVYRAFMFSYFENTLETVLRFVFVFVWFVFCSRKTEAFKTKLTF